MNVCGGRLRPPCAKPDPKLHFRICTVKPWQIAPLARVPPNRYHRFLLMGSPEFHELQEHAEHGAHNPSLAPVSLTMAILAVALAIVSLLGHRAHTEEMLLQTQVSDRWAYYQAKNIRMHEDDVMADLASVMVTTDTQKAAQVRDKYKTEADRYRTDKNDIEAEAHKLEKETQLEGRRSDRFDLSEVFLEIALVVTSITLLSGRRMFWYSGIALSAIGVVVALTSVMVR